jgi:hypothetical protein
MDDDDNIKKLEEYFKNSKDFNIKKKESNKEKIYMLEILLDLLPEDYKEQDKKYNKRISELKNKEKEIDEKIKNLNEMLYDIETIKNIKKISKDGKKKIKNRRKSKSKRIIKKIIRSKYKHK